VRRARAGGERGYLERDAWLVCDRQQMLELLAHDVSRADRSAQRDLIDDCPQPKDARGEPLLALLTEQRRASAAAFPAWSIIDYFAVVGDATAGRLRGWRPRDGRGPAVEARPIRSSRDTYPYSARH
jgi:hypothetical protein